MPSWWSGKFHPFARGVGRIDGGWDGLVGVGVCAISGVSGLSLPGLAKG